MKDSIKIKGQYRVEGFNYAGVKIIDETYDNVVVQGFFDAVLGFLNGDTADIDITEMATGDGTTSALKTDTELENEIFRKAVASKVVTSTKITVKLVLSTAESNFNIKEIGVFSDSMMISRCNVDIDKNSSIQYLITYYLTME